VARWLARSQQWPAVATDPASLAAVRTAIGTVMLVAPQVVPHLLGVGAASRARISWVVQMLGVREVALGAGVLAAQQSADARGWVVAGGVCDLVDAVVVAAAARRGAVDAAPAAAVAVSALAAGVVGLARAGTRG